MSTRRRILPLFVSLPFSFFAATVHSATPEQVPPLPDITHKQIENGHVSLAKIRDAGLRVFSTGLIRGYGDGDPNLDGGECTERRFAPGCRSPLQSGPGLGNGRFSRINGLDGQSCQECHALLEVNSAPPKFGMGGAGNLNDHVLLQPKKIDAQDDPENMENLKGYVHFDGRMINPPHVMGAGAVELISKAITKDLQWLNQKAKKKPDNWVKLISHGIDFGKIRYLSDTKCGPTREPTVSQRLRYFGVYNPEVYQPYTNTETYCFEHELKGIDPDLVVKPFGRKGEFTSIRDFDLGAMQFHFGIEPDELAADRSNPVGNLAHDGDKDGVTKEMSVGNMDALGIFIASLPPPKFIKFLKTKPGFQVFEDIGCAECHIPEIKTKSKTLSFSFPEVPSDPDANTFYQLNLADLFPREGYSSLRVQLFSDFKRHDMGPELAESFHRPIEEGNEKQNREFITAKLWGVADTAPYMHDGRAFTLHEAIMLHGGEAEDAKDKYVYLSEHKQQAILDFLGMLRMPDKGGEIYQLKHSLPEPESDYRGLFDNLGLW